MSIISNHNTLRLPRPAAASTSGPASTMEAARPEADSKKFWKPAAEWAGRLVLPSEDERKDGGVYFEVRQAPRQFPQLQGKKVWLEFQKADWVDRVTTDVDFSKRAEASEVKGNVHPERLDGWKNVSPMESLAGARQTDNMIVALKSPRWVDGKLTVEREPVQISGTQKALVTFEKKIDAHTWQVRHYNPESKAFDGPSETVSTSGRDDLAPMKDRRLNNKGWYLYGDANAKGQMTVAALEPRELFQVSADQMIRGKDSSVDYLRNENWRLEEQSKGQMTRTLLKPKAAGEKSPVLKNATEEAFKLGDRTLLLHLFGGAVGAPATLGVYLGHFSFGTAEVVKDEFTGENRFDVEYKQVYAHNRGGVTSGSQKWHAYMGDTERGYLYDRPVSDSIVQLPELFDDSQGVAPFGALEQRLEEVMARYRSGQGEGASIVTAAQNCSQDSSQALYAAMSDWKKAIANGSMSATVTAVAEDLASHLTPMLGWAPREWRQTANNEKVGAHELRWLPALKSPNTILPRKNLEKLTELALENQKSVLLVKTDVLGADNPQAVPLEPFG